MAEVYVTGTGQRLKVHDRDVCVGRACVVHAPTDHRMRGYPTHWRRDRMLMERICPHGVGHPDPDHLAYVQATFLDQTAAGIHGCDGCCRGSG